MTDRYLSRTAAAALGALLLGACGGSSPPTAPETGEAADSVAAVDESPAPDPAAERARLVEMIEADGKVDIAAIDRDVARIRDDMIVDRYLEALYAEAADEPTIEAYYRDNASSFAQRQARLAHVLVRFPATVSEEERGAALTSVLDLAARLRTGEDFAAVAAAASEDETTAARGGELGWVAEHEIAEPVMAAALALEPGELSEPVVTSYGIHLLKLLEPVRTVQRPLADVRPSIVRTLREEARREALARMQPDD